MDEATLMQDIIDLREQLHRLTNDANSSDLTLIATSQKLDQLVLKFVRLSNQAELAGSWLNGDKSHVFGSHVS